MYEPERRQLRPLEPETFPPEMQEHVRWHLVFTRADAVTEQTGLGLANVWYLIKRGRRDEAMALLDDIEDYWIKQRHNW